jgi:menaquinone C8-methyltransferase
MLTPLIHRIISQRAKAEFARAMHFDTGPPPDLPPCRDRESRLLYLHVPFCQRLCPYCSFNRFVFQEGVCRRYFKALRQEMGLYRSRGFDFQGLYVGGGTPTILPDELAETLLMARELFGIREISVETNPNHLTDDTVELLRKAGVNRLSVGVQSFEDGLLRQMERLDKYGSGADILARLKTYLGAFDTLNADMIFNFPTQTPRMLDRDLDILLESGVDQVTYYPLMVSDSTRQMVTRTLGYVDMRQEAAYYRRILEKLRPTYRLSSAWCFSRKPSLIDEYIVEYDEYAGLGSGSIGYLQGVCYANTFDVAEYIARVGRGQVPLMASRAFSIQDRVRYDFLMKLFGMELKESDLRKKYGSVYGYLWKDIAAFVAAGGLRRRNGTFFLTERGCYQWVILMREFFTAVNNFRDFCREAMISPLVW